MIRKRPLFWCFSGIFAFGEDSHACRLRASSTRSARRMRTPRLAKSSALGWEASIPLPYDEKSHPFGWLVVWQRNRDSNPNIQSQSLLCYRYTIPLCKILSSYKRRFCEPHIQSLLLGRTIFSPFRLADIIAYIPSRRNIPSECRVCCATVTQFRYIVVRSSNGLYFITKKSVCQ